MTTSNHEIDIKKSVKILVVDDLPFMRRMLRIALNNMGYKNIVEVENGAETINELERYSWVSKDGYSLMLLDLNMPEKSGLDVLKHVRANDAIKKLPIIVITAENSKEVILQTMYYGAEEYMIKPITQKEVMKKVEKVLNYSGKLIG